MIFQWIACCCYSMYLMNQWYRTDRNMNKLMVVMHRPASITVLKSAQTDFSPQNMSQDFFASMTTLTIYNAASSYLMSLTDGGLSGGDSYYGCNICTYIWGEKLEINWFTRGPLASGRGITMMSVTLRFIKGASSQHEVVMTQEAATG